MRADTNVAGQDALVLVSGGGGDLDGAVSVTGGLGRVASAEGISGELARVQACRACAFLDGGRDRDDLARRWRSAGVWRRRHAPCPGLPRTASPCQIGIQVRNGVAATRDAPHTRNPHVAVERRSNDSGGKASERAFLPALGRRRVRRREAGRSTAGRRIARSRRRTS